MIEHKNIKHVGKVAVFYVPVEKLTEAVRNEIHDFFVSEYCAYTHECSEIRGYWVTGGEIVRDKHERYEVAFHGDEKFKAFIGFLSELCGNIKEDSIYLTVADEAYLVEAFRSKERNNLGGGLSKKNFKYWHIQTLWKFLTLSDSGWRE